jgi:P-type Cu+ transporter
MQTQTLRVKGMHCASCSSVIEKTLKKTEGVQSAEVNYGTETAKVSFDETKISPQYLSQKIEPLGYSLIVPMAEATGMSKREHAAHLGLNQSEQEKLREINDMRMKVLSVLPLAAFSVLLMAWDALVRFRVVAPMPDIWEEFIHHLLPVFATYTLFVVGAPYLRGFYRFLRYGKANMDTLIGIGTLAAFVYSFIVSAFEETLRPYLNVNDTYYDVTIVVIAFITLGKYLEAQSKLKTGDAIQKLLNLQAKTALVMRNGSEVEIPIQDVVLGDVVRVKPASRIPVDGVIIDGASFVDESMLTGEPMPIEKQEGDAVAAGTMNTNGVFTFRTTKVGAETMLAHIIRMVGEAQGSKAPIQALADTVSSVFVPVVIGLSFVALGLWLVIGIPALGFSQAISYGLVSFVGILVIACPCALGLATPTAIIVGVGKGAKEGILIKDAATLEKLHGVTTIVVDKTGTITKGKPELISIEPQGTMEEKEVMRVLASLEASSEHPIAHAILSYAKEHGLVVEKVQGFEMMKGKGVKGEVGGTAYFAGNAKLMADLGLIYDKKTIERQTKQGNTPIFLATEKAIIGIAMVADALKPEAKRAIHDLHALGIKVVMLTGDDRNTAKAIADRVGIDEVIAEVLPQDKMDRVKVLQANGEVVAMAGDGVNDAPALAQADVGIAMATGTDVAIESAGMTLLHGDISKLVKAIRLSKITMRGVKQNLFWAFIYNIIGIPLAGGLFYPFFGWLLNPIFAGLAMAFSSVSVVGNSLRLKTKHI